ncbi:MAG TPA: hypothetical protein VGL36_35745 [Kribbella sp.]
MSQGDYRSFTPADRDRMVAVLGKWSSGPTWWSPITAVSETVPGLYVMLDELGRIRWMGSAGGRLGVLGRVRSHLNDHGHPWKKTTFDRIVVAPATDQISRSTLRRCEGRAAESMCLDRYLPGHIWPPPR